MKIIKLSAIDSTNSFLKNMVLDGSPEHLTCVVAEHQTAGRGQMGTTWVSEPGKNLMFSVYLGLGSFAVDRQFYLSMAVSVSVLRALETFQMPDLRIKWPNDILSGNKKICGILMEYLVKGSTVQSVIAGVGLNVNQNGFEGLPQASSMKLVCGRIFPLEEVLQKVLEYIARYEALVRQGELEAIHKEYEGLLFRKGKASTFKNARGEMFVGVIQGVLPSGQLRLLLADEEQQDFDLKELSLLY